jgi:hypothetical protein
MIEDRKKTPSEKRATRKRWLVVLALLGVATLTLTAQIEWGAMGSLGVLVASLIVFFVAVLLVGIHLSPEQPANAMRYISTLLFIIGGVTGAFDGMALGGSRLKFTSFTTVMTGVTVILVGGAMLALVIASRLDTRARVATAEAEEKRRLAWQAAMASRGKQPPVPAARRRRTVQARPYEDQLARAGRGGLRPELQEPPVWWEPDDAVPMPRDPAEDDDNGFADDPALRDIRVGPPMRDVWDGVSVDSDLPLLHPDGDNTRPRADPDQLRIRPQGRRRVL